MLKKSQRIISNVSFMLSNKKLKHLNINKTKTKSTQTDSTATQYKKVYAETKKFCKS